MPGLLPGLTVPAPPRAPTAPLPARLAPLPTVTTLPAIDPLTVSCPALTVVAPVMLFDPVTVSVPPPVFSRVPVPDIAPA